MLQKTCFLSDRCFEVGLSEPLSSSARVPFWYHRFASVTLFVHLIDMLNVPGVGKWGVNLFIYVFSSI